jgi:hypothetical protein
MNVETGIAGANASQAWGPWLRGVGDGLASSLVVWAVLIAVFLLVIPLIATRLVRRRVFWCQQAQRDVETEIEERGVPGLRRASAVVSCTAFDPPGAVQCTRSCLAESVRVRLPMTPPFRLREP